MSHLLLYVPITVLVLAVIEACKSDDPKKIAKSALKNFAVLTLVLVVGGAIVFFVNKYA